MCEECVAGFVDSDEDPATPCHECLAGHYWHSFAQGRSECISCAAGRADLDMDSTTTECEDCSVGEYAGLGSSACTSCASTGQFDDDRDPSTPCSDTDICLQVCAAGYQDDDCDELTPCVACAEGSYAVGGVFPESRCVACAAGLSDDDSDASTP